MAVTTKRYTVGRKRHARTADQTRDAVLDAAQECFLRYGIGRCTIDDVVRVAKVPRATLYRHAGGKSELVAAVALRDTERFLATLGRRVRRSGSFADGLVEGVLLAAKELQSNQFLALMMEPEARTVAAEVSHQLQTAMRERLATFIEPFLATARASGQLRPDLETKDAVEWLLRTIVSLATVPEPWPRSAQERRAFLHRVLVPAFLTDRRSSG